MKNNSTAGYRLKLAREAAGFRAAVHFCKKFKIPTSTYSLHENGGREISVDTANRYAKYLGVSATWLLTGEGAPYPNKFPEETSPISLEEFNDLLSYSSNQKEVKERRICYAPMHDIVPIVFAKIVISLVKVTNELNFSISDNELTLKAKEFYEDITSATLNSDEQIKMIDLLIISFKRQILNYMKNQSTVGSQE